MSLSDVLLRSVCGVFVAGSMVLGTATAADAAEYDDIPKHFFELVAKGDFGAAIDFAGGTNAAWDLDMIDDLRKKATKGLVAFGSYTYHELISEHKIGTRLVRRHYIIGYEKAVLELTLTLYRPKDKWHVHGINYSDNVDGIFAKFPPK